MRIEFTKLQGTGNDFIIINGIKYNIDDPVSVARKLCKRHYGIGADGLILALFAENGEHDFKMRMFNPDGSEAEMCGNGIRCFAHYLYAEDITDKKNLLIETKAGLIIPGIQEYRGRISIIKVDMGKPRFNPADIPVNRKYLGDNESDYIKEYPLKVDGKSFKINCVSMGNPHTVIFSNNPENIELTEWGQKIENHEFFPARTNVEFVRIISREEIDIKVWERGAGITLACGTGACAAAAAGIRNNLLNDNVLAHLPGGDLNLDWSGNNIQLTGPAETVFKGEIVL